MTTADEVSRRWYITFPPERTWGGGQAARPFLKWAGGKTQHLSTLRELMPENFARYFEPFLGGGALFFNQRPRVAVIGDLNRNLIDTYLAVRDNVEDLIGELSRLRNNEADYYAIRSQNPDQLSVVSRAAREVYLNKTCFNGLYRVNRQGQFNVPFGRRKNPLICDVDTLRAASAALQGTQLVWADYRSTLRNAAPGDLVYLDPPYHPSGMFADFNRYTKEQFYEEDHVELRDEFARLVDLGCYVLLTNSNTEFVRELYADYEYRVVSARRNISSQASSRSGEDLVVIGSPARKRAYRRSISVHQPTLLSKFPGTRFMGSKYRILPHLKAVLKDIDFSSALDAFSGSGCVAYTFKELGAATIANDFLSFSYHIANATVANSSETLNKEDIDLLLQPNPKKGTFISDTFRGLYFTDEENAFLDSLRSNIDLLGSDFKKSLALAAISRACLKRRPRGVFTYIGTRYLDGRADLRMDLREHFVANVEAFNTAVFDNSQHSRALNCDVFDLDVSADVVYLDPPYYTPHSDNEYIRRYHFIEGLCRNWDGVEIQHYTKTKKFKKYPTPFSRRDTAYDAFDRLFERFRESVLIVSYSSNGYPTKNELFDLLSRYKREVAVHHIDHTYSFGTHAHRQNNGTSRVQEYLFVAR